MSAHVIKFFFLCFHESGAMFLVNVNDALFFRNMIQWCPGFLAWYHLVPTARSFGAELYYITMVWCNVQTQFVRIAAGTVPAFYTMRAQGAVERSNQANEDSLLSSFWGNRGGSLCVHI